MQKNRPLGMRHFVTHHAHIISQERCCESESWWNAPCRHRSWTRQTLPALPGAPNYPPEYWSLHQKTSHNPRTAHQENFSVSHTCCTPSALLVVDPLMRRSPVICKLHTKTPEIRQPAPLDSNLDMRRSPVINKSHTRNVILILKLIRRPRNRRMLLLSCLKTISIWAQLVASKTSHNLPPERYRHVHVFQWKPVCIRHHWRVS